MTAQFQPKVGCSTSRRRSTDSKPLLVRDRRQRERRHREHPVLRLGADQGRRRDRDEYRVQEAGAALEPGSGAGQWVLARGESERHAQRRRTAGLSNNDNSGTSPFLVFPFTPNFMDLLPTSSGDSLLPSDFPNNPFERSNPLQTFQFLTNNEDVWRLLGTSTLAVARRSGRPRATSSSSASAGVDYFQQDNNFVSPPELQYEPNDGQPGTVVLSKSSNRNLNLALNATHTYLPGDPDHGTQWTTSAGIQFEERRLFATQILGRTLLTGQDQPAAGREPDRALAHRAGARPRRLRPGGGAAGRPPAAAHRRRARRPEQRQRQPERSSSSIPKFAASYLFEQPVRRRGRAQVPGGVRADRQPGGLRRPVLAGHHRHDRRGLRHLHRHPRRGREPQARAAEGVRGGLRRHAWRTGARELIADACTSGTSRDLLLEQHAGALVRPGEPDLQLRPARCGTRASRRRSRSSRCRPGT